MKKTLGGSSQSAREPARAHHDTLSTPEAALELVKFSTNPRDFSKNPNLQREAVDLSLPGPSGLQSFGGKKHFVRRLSFNGNNSSDDESTISAHSISSEALRLGEDFKENNPPKPFEEMFEKYQDFALATHPGLRKELLKINLDHQERLQLNEIEKARQIDQVNKEYAKEIAAGDEEFEKQRETLQRDLITRLENQKTLIQRQHEGCRITSSRRIPLFNYPVQRQLRRRTIYGTAETASKKPRLTPIRHLLEPGQIEEDLSLIRNLGFRPPGAAAPTPSRRGKASKKTVPKRSQRKRK